MSEGCPQTAKKTAGKMIARIGSRIVVSAWMRTGATGGKYSLRRSVTVWAKLLRTFDEVAR